MPMNKRFWVICSVIAFGLLVLSAMGLSSLRMHEKALRADRQREFMDAAKKISYDVKKKVDSFLQAEHARLYTDYQPYYVPEFGNNFAALVPSPLANTFANELANGYFQLDSEGQLTSPHFANQIQQQEAVRIDDHSDYFRNVRENLLPSLEDGHILAKHRVEPKTEDTAANTNQVATSRDFSRPGTRWTYANSANNSAAAAPLIENSKDELPVENSEPIAKNSKSAAETKEIPSRRVEYRISNLDELQQTNQTQVIRQQRDNYNMNIMSNNAEIDQEPISQAVEEYNRKRVANRSISQSAYPIDPSSQTPSTEQAMAMQTVQPGLENMPQQITPLPQQNEAADNSQASAAPTQAMQMQQQEQVATQQADTVQVRIEPFVPITVQDAGGNGNGIFAGQVFLLRHVQIEDRHLIQGFQLNEEELLAQIAESTRGLVLRGMGYEISKTERPDSAFAAILQFDFGEVVLNLLEQDPGYIQAQVLRIRNWFYGILAVVWLSVLLAMAALWQNLHEQAQLSRKKDDFISAVSHELRTPLTSIRMYTEMLEKDWVRTDQKRREYYGTMRQETERLSRLVENVLDFSRVQRGKKQYHFTLGDINVPIRQAAEMMRPCIEKNGFMLMEELSDIPPFAFDPDAVMQMVINLLDNAIKYAQTAVDKRIFLRTRSAKGKVLIEVEDRGPGISRSSQKKVFDAFYRCEDESTRQTTGTGLGLALVKGFAQAHNGSVEIGHVKPMGALFRITLCVD